MKKIINYIFIAVLFSSCVFPKRMDRDIAKFESSFTTKLKTSDYIILKTSGFPKNDTPSVSEKGPKKLLPLLVYWHSEETIITSLNPYIGLVNMNSTILQYANKKGLREKLNGQKIELTVDKMPTMFTLVDKYYLIFLGLYYVDWQKVYITPHKQDLIINYRILNGATEAKKGTITVDDPLQPRSLKFLQATRKMTWGYLEEYDNIIKDMSKQFVDKLLLEI
jgi:hypothetical protein